MLLTMFSGHILVADASGHTTVYQRHVVKCVSEPLHTSGMSECGTNLTFTLVLGQPWSDG